MVPEMAPTFLPFRQQIVMEVNLVPLRQGEEEESAADCPFSLTGWVARMLALLLARMTT